MSKELTDRNFGDCEIRTISFAGETALIEIFDPMNATSCKLLFHAVGVMLFETTHVQNVIDSIALFDSMDEAMSDDLAGKFLRKVTPADLATQSRARFAHIRPITGGETIIAFETFEIQ